MKRLEALDKAIEEAYGDSLYSEGHEWLLGMVRGLRDKQIKEVLTDANMHSACEVFQDLRQQHNKVWRIYQTGIYRLWCFVGNVELKIRHHGQRIGAIRG